MAIAFSPRPREARQHPSTLVDLTLDPAQARAATLEAGTNLLVLGEAGHGKTTVLLHRLAHLYRESARERRRFRAAVLVPSEGLVRLLQPLAVRLGADVRVRLYDTWARAQARRAFSDLPRRVSEDASAGVIRFKRHPALRGAIATIAGRPPSLIDDDRDAPPVATRALAVRADLQQLFGDRVLVDDVARHAGLGEHVVREVLEHTRVQFSDVAEVELAHVDRARLVTVDRRSIDAGTASGDAATFDVEDAAVLFAIDRMRAERTGQPATTPLLYDCIAIDEAQELAPLELALIGRSLAPGGSLIVAGDADQQTDATSTFVGWDETMRELGADRHERVVLEVSYRCPPDVVALAHRALDPTADVMREAIAFDEDQALAAELGRALASLRAVDPRASVALIVRDARYARRLSGALAGVARARLVLDGRFRAGGETFVTTVEQVKGLELDYVVVADASAASYSGDAASRRALYVAITRARAQTILAYARNRNASRA